MLQIWKFHSFNFCSILFYYYILYLLLNYIFYYYIILVIFCFLYFRSACNSQVSFLRIFVSVHLIYYYNFSKDRFNRTNIFLWVFFPSTRITQPCSMFYIKLAKILETPQGLYKKRSHQFCICNVFLVNSFCSTL